jgi:HD superfamily phosphodiesterase
MENLSSSDLVLLQVAAWFHDLGYLSSYIGHEESSAGMAQEFLEELQMPIDGIQRVMDLIAATNWWVNYFYGKHAKRIRKILDDLKE